MMFAVDDDDADFSLPAGGGSSKLASLFDVGQKKEEGNASLTYMPPKQPKKSRANSQQPGSSTRESSPGQMAVIHVVAVNAFKLQDGNYAPKGKVGFAILGTQEASLYQLLLYRGKQEHLAMAKITSTFNFTVQENNYASFYDNQKQNWSVMFESNSDVVEFVKQVIIAKVNSHDGKLKLVMTQDMVLGEGAALELGDLVEVKFTGWIFSNKKLGEVFDSNVNGQKAMRFKLGKGKVIKGWEEGLIGMKKSGRRFLIVPPHLGYGDQGEGSRIPPNSTLAFDVEVSHIRLGKDKDSTGGLSLSDTPLMQEEDKSGSSDDVTVKARGASLSEALSSSPKSDKAHIISRMARMGQATLPMPSHVTAHPSDSSENEEETNQETPKSTHHKPAVRPRAISSQQPSFQHSQDHSQQLQQQQQQAMAMYQSNQHWQAPFRAFGPESMAQMFPLTYATMPPTVSTPIVSTAPSVPAVDAQLNLLMSESRSQNTEVRIAVSRVSDRLEQIMSKVDQIHMLQQQQQQLQHLQQAGGFMYGLQNTATYDRFTQVSPQIQTLTEENMRLRRLLEEKPKSLDAGGEEEVKLREAVKAAQEEVDKLNRHLQTSKSDLKDEKEKTSSLESHLKEVKELYDSQKNQILSLENMVADLKKGSTCVEKCLDEKLIILEEEKRNLCKELEELKSKYETEVARLTLKMEEDKKEWESMKADFQESLSQKLQDVKESCDKQLAMAEADKTRLATQIKELQKNLQEKELNSNDVDNEWKDKLLKFQKEHGDQLEFEKQLAHLKEELTLAQNKSKGDQVVDVSAEVKRVMNMLYRNLQPEFERDQSYEGSHIRKTLAATIRSVTLQLLEEESFSKGADLSMETSSSERAESGADKSSTVENSDISGDNMIVSDGDKCPSTENEDEKVQQDNKIIGGIQVPLSKNPSGSSSRDSSAERGWKPQPPPPPLFDDEDDDDDWPK